MEDDEQKPWLDGTLSCHLSSERVTWQHYIVNVGLGVPKNHIGPSARTPRACKEQMYSI